jgi:hypothetical protein
LLCDLYWEVQNCLWRFFLSWLFGNGSEELKLLEASIMMRFDAEIEGLGVGQDVEVGGLDWTSSESILFRLWTS